MAINLPCCSMAHVVDRATAFLFAQPPYLCTAVRPNGVVLERGASEGIKPTKLYVHVASWPRRGEEPVTFLDDVQDAR